MSTASPGSAFRPRLERMEARSCGVLLTMYSSTWFARSFRAVDLAPVSHADHQDEQHLVLDLVQHPVVADPQPEVGLPVKCRHSWWSRVVGQGVDLVADALLVGPMDLPQVPLSGGQEGDCVAGLQSPRSALTFSQGMGSPPSARPSRIAARSAPSSSRSSISRSARGTMAATSFPRRWTMTRWPRAARRSAVGTLLTVTRGLTRLSIG